MNNFTQTYLIIGIALYLMTATFICVIGKDYIDEKFNYPVYKYDNIM